MATWAWQLLTPAGAPLGSLSTATARRLVWQLDGAATATFSLLEDSAEAGGVVELGTDVAVSRNGAALFRGRIGGSTDTISATAETVALTATDYRGLLDHRLLWPTSTLDFTAVDQADIAWQLIADTQAKPGGNLGIIRGAAGPTGTARSRQYGAGVTVGQTLGDLGRVEGGFDWEIDAALRFNLWSPQRGATTPVLLDWGRDVVALSSTTNPAGYANAVYFTGSSATTPASVDVGTFPAGVGRWDVQKSDPNLTVQANLAERAAFELAVDSQQIPSLGLTLKPGVWNPAGMWLGDAVRFLIKVGRLNLDVTRRIMQIDVTLSDDGDEQVVLTIGLAPLRLADQLNAVTAALSALQTGPGGAGPTSGLPGYSGGPVPPSSGGLPPGGTTGQALEKASNSDYDTTWATLPTGGGGGGAKWSGQCQSGPQTDINANTTFVLGLGGPIWDDGGAFGSNKLFLQAAGTYLIVASFQITNYAASGGRTYSFLTTRYNSGGAIQVQLQQLAYVPANVNTAQWLQFQHVVHVRTTTTTDYVQFTIAPVDAAFSAANPDAVTLESVSYAQV